MMGHIQGGHLYQCLPHSSSDIAEEQAERTYKPKDREECREMLSSGHKVAAALVTLEHLWYPQKIKAIKNSSMEKEDSQDLSPS